MTAKTQNIVNWVLAGLVAFIFVGSGISKITANAEALEAAAKFGLNASSYTALGIIELIAVALFLYPRTGLIGVLLLVAYMGGAIATHLEHGESLIAPIAISAFVWIVSVVRFPEMSSRLLGKN
jgi:DoxX-like family